jgi:adenine/guanine phosphoribosyltransferase-like PRPP-binding protein
MMPYTWNRTASHLRPIVDPEELQKRVNEAVSRLKCVEFDAIACTGISGIAFAAALSLQAQKPVVIVRKQEAPMSHSCRSIEGPDEIRTFVFVDDLISTGSTLFRVNGAIKSQYPEATLVGIYCYTGVGTDTFCVPNEFKGVRIIR